MKNQETRQASAARVPSLDRISKYLMFGLSLPERTIRSTSAVVSGAVNESANLLLPQAFRSSKSYDRLVKQMLNFLAHDVGGVKRDERSRLRLAVNYNTVQRTTMNLSAATR